MRFDIESFKNNFRDGARASLFYYKPMFPGGVAVDVGLERITYLVKTATLPESTLEETIVNWQGYDFPFASKHTFAEFTMNFNVDREAKVRKTFENWINKIHDPVTNKYALVEDYMQDQRIQLLGYEGETVLEYTLFNAWPRSIGAIELDHASTDIATFDVTWRYTHHTMAYKETGS